MIPADTSPDAHRAQVEAFRRMAPGRRMEIALEMSRLVLETTRAGIRSRHPEYTEAMVDLALRRLTLGDELFCAAHPDSPKLDP